MNTGKCEVWKSALFHPHRCKNKATHIRTDGKQVCLDHNHSKLGPVGLALLKTPDPVELGDWTKLCEYRRALNMGKKPGRLLTIAAKCQPEAYHLHCTRDGVATKAGPPITPYQPPEGTTGQSEAKEERKG